jgi:hypothetical protein
MCIIFMTNYFLVGDDVFIDNETLLVTDFVNLKIKSVQSFRNTHRNKVCMYIHIVKYSYVYEYLRLYRVSKKTPISPASHVCSVPFSVFSFRGKKGRGLITSHVLMTTSLFPDCLGY